MQRRIVVAVAGNAGTTITAAPQDTPAPEVGYRWMITHVSVEVANYESGPMAAELRIGDRFICATRQGYLDTADGSPVELTSSEPVIVTWTPGPQVRPATNLQCKATIIVEQMPSGSGARRA